MNKTLKIILWCLGAVIILFIVIWFLFIRTSSSPVAQTIRDILPFGSSGGLNFPTQNNPGEGTNGGVNIGAPKVDLFKLSDDPVAGSVSFIRDRKLYVRYVDRATGHIYEVSPITLERKKITNNTLPKIYEAHFASDGNKVLYRFLKDDSDLVENLSITVVPPRSTSTDSIHTIVATPLRSDITEVVVNGNTLNYVLDTTGEVATSNFESTNVRTIYKGAFREWRLSPAGSGLVITTKAGASLSGYSYLLGAGGSLTKLLGPLTALTVTSNKAGNRIVYSYNEGPYVRLFARNLSTRSIVEFSPGALAEKCVWSSKEGATLYCASSSLENRAIDDWYKGIIQFSDNIWRFDGEIGFSDMIVSPEDDFDTTIDAINLSLTPDEDYLTFMNKIDMSLWALKLTEGL